MRWISKPERTVNESDESKVGELRSIERFALFPVLANNAKGKKVWVWLEKFEVKQKFIKQYYVRECEIPFERPYIESGYSYYWQTYEVNLILRP